MAIIGDYDMAKQSIKNKYQKRAFNLSNIHVRKANGSAGSVSGIAAVFNKLSEDLGGFREKIQPGAFAKSIKDGDIRALFNHDPNLILGRTKSGTLSLKEIEAGLSVSIDMPDTSIANDLTVSMKRGDISQMSFGFTPVKDKWETVDGKDVRTLLEVKLFDVSPVTFPAYPETSVQARSKENQQYLKLRLADLRRDRPTYKRYQAYKVKHG